MDNFDLRKYLAEGKLLKEDYDKESLIKALGDNDDAFIQLGDGREFIIYNPNSNNDDKADMWPSARQDAYCVQQQAVINSELRRLRSIHSSSDAGNVSGPVHLGTESEKPQTV